MPIKFTVVDLVQWKYPTMLRICGSGLRHLTENQHAVSHKELAFPDHHFWESSMKTLISFLIKFKSCKGKPLGQLSLKQWFPTGGSLPQSGSRRSFCGVANSSLYSLLKSRIFRTSYINILLHQQNRNTDRSLWSSHYLHHNSYLISPIQFKSTWL